MARFDKLAVLTKMGEAPIVPVFYHNNAQTACAVVKACYEGGIRAFEFTNRGDFAHEVFAEVVKFAAKECPDMAVGVGSVVEPATAALYIQLGACFVVGPLFNPDVAKTCNAAEWPTHPAAARSAKLVSPRKQAATFARCSPVMFSALNLSKGFSPPCHGAS